MAIAFLKYLKVKLKIPSLLAACPDCCLVKAFYSHKSTPFHMNPTEFQNFPSLYFSPILYQFCDKEMCHEESNALLEKLDTSPSATGDWDNQQPILHSSEGNQKNEEWTQSARLETFIIIFSSFPRPADGEILEGSSTKNEAAIGPSLSPLPGYEIFPLTGRLCRD